MNLHQIASAAISAVNPMVNVKVFVSTGSVVGADGIRVATFDDPVTVQAQIQPLTGGDLRQLEGLNLQGEYQGVYLNGRIDGILRTENKGGDKIVFPDNRVYLVTTVLESWPDWTKCAVTLQNGA